MYGCVYTHTHIPTYIVYAHAHTLCIHIHIHTPKCIHTLCVCVCVCVYIYSLPVHLLMVSAVAPLLWLSLGGGTYLFQLAFLFSSDTHPEVQLLDFMGPLFLIFGGIFVPFPAVAAPNYNPTNGTRRFPSFHALATFIFNAYYLLR